MIRDRLEGKQPADAHGDIYGSIKNSLRASVLICGLSFFQICLVKKPARNFGLKIPGE
jgi:hypothetical protein